MYLLAGNSENWLETINTDDIIRIGIIRILSGAGNQSILPLGNAFGTFLSNEYCGMNDDIHGIPSNTYNLLLTCDGIPISVAGKLQ